MNVTVISGRVLKEPVFKINETEKGVFHVETFNVPFLFIGNINVTELNDTLVFVSHCMIG